LDQMLMCAYMCAYIAMTTIYYKYVYLQVISPMKLPTKQVLYESLAPTMNVL
jgi:hypothetical protein